MGDYGGSEDLGILCYSVIIKGVMGEQNEVEESMFAGTQIVWS
jgi:hypothetical protein